MRMFDDIDKDGLQTSVRNIIYLGLMKRGHAMEELTSLFAVLSDIQFNPFLNESVASSIPANARRGYHHLFDGFFIISVWNEKLKQLTLDTGFVDQQVSNWDKWVNNKDFLSVHSGETNLIVELKKYPFVTSPQSKTQLKIEGQKVFIYPYK